MTRYSALVFDLDGTLLHSAPDLHAAANVALVELGRPELDLETVISFIGNGVEKLVERCLKATGGCENGIHAKALSVFMNSYSANMTTLTRPYPGVVNCLSKLEQSGAKMGICTNKPTAAARGICDALDLSRYFAVIAGAEEGQVKKPDPKPLLDVLSRLNADPVRALYIGDSSIDHSTAKNAGVEFRLFSGGYLKAPITDLPKSNIFVDWAQSGLCDN